MKSDSEGHKSRSKIQTHKNKILLKPRSWVNLGYSIANSEGETLFLKNAIPGETVDALFLKNLVLYFGELFPKSMRFHRRESLPIVAYFLVVAVVLIVMFLIKKN